VWYFAGATRAGETVRGRREVCRADVGSAHAPTHPRCVRRPVGRCEFPYNHRRLVPPRAAPDAGAEVWRHLQVALSVIVLAGSVLLTGIVRHLALRHGLVDVPNARSSHVRATPRGGGIAVALAALGGVTVLKVTGAVSSPLFLVLTVGGGAVALVGLLDDRYSVPPAVRFLVHVLAAWWALYCLGGLPPWQFGEHVVSLGWVGYVVGTLGVVWVLNLFNFMDGIDGIATGEALFVLCAATLLGSAGARASEAGAPAWALAAASAGFLCWNWPPAKVFLGDVGSGFLGYGIAVLALAAARSNAVALWIWLILMGVFFVDASVTLWRRLLRGERIFEAHRTHAYQRLARRWGRHRPVTVAVLLVNVLWLLPCAALAAHYPSRAGLITALALVPLAVVILLVGRHRDEP
jgi:Fuc2NAc and GlcNAc transferase